MFVHLYFPGYCQDVSGFSMKIQTEVLIIGGGATGVGISRDLSLRGIPSLLIEKGDFLSGASGRNHGLFHSGGRYAVSDPEAARECIAENRIHRKIAPHCIEPTDGFFVSLPEDGLEFRDRFLKACEKAEIPATLLSRDEALALEPGSQSGSPERRESPGWGHRSLHPRPRERERCREQWRQIPPPHGNHLPHS